MFDCKEKSSKEVKKYFKGLPGFEHNPDLPGVIESYSTWKLCSLEEEEFYNLICPYPSNSKFLLKNAEIKNLKEGEKENVKERVKKLNEGEEFNPIIVRKAKEELEGGSFYIEDGKKRSLAWREHFRDFPYKPITAYVGSK